MIQKYRILSSAAKLLAVLTALTVLLAGFAIAEEDAYPHFGGRRTDAAPEEFFGSWFLHWVYSDGPVDMYNYGHVEIYPDFQTSFALGNEDGETVLNVTAEVAENGCLHIPQEDGDGFTLFLTGDGVMGCIPASGASANVYYMEYSGDLYEEYYADLHFAEMLVTHIGETRSDVSAEELQGLWCSQSFVDEAGELVPLYMIGAEIKILIEGDHATVTYGAAGSDKITYETPVAYESDYAEIRNEEDDASQYLLVCADGRLALVDDAANPGEALFFIPEAQWLEEIAAADHIINPQPGEQVAVDSLEPMIGDWVSTHVNYGGDLYPIRVMSGDMYIFIDEEGGIVVGDDYEYLSADGQLTDGYLTVVDEYGYESYFFYYDGDFLIQSDYADDLTYSIYYQRLEAQ